MTVMVLDSTDGKRLRAKRRALGLDRYDEVWEGVYMMMPIANLEHQQIATYLAGIIHSLLASLPIKGIYVGANVSDRKEGWKKNYRIPDLAVYFEGNPAEYCETHWCGGPDFGVEITSPRDRSRDKLAFYANIGVRELMIIDRKPWRLELYRLKADELKPVGISTAEDAVRLRSEVLPLTFALRAEPPRPRIVVTKIDGTQEWLI